MTERRNEPTALQAFMIRKAEIDTALARLKNLSDDHFGCVATSIDWGDVGTLAHYAGLLKRITDLAFREGEYAD